MCAQQRQLLFVSCALNFSYHQAMQVLYIGKGPLLPGTVRHPRRMLEDPSRGRDEAVIRKRIEVFDGNHSLDMVATESSGADWSAHARRTAQKTRSGVAGL